MNAEQQTSSAAVGGHDNAATGDNADRDYIMMNDLLQDMADDDDGDGSEPVRYPETTDFFSQSLTVLTTTTFYLGARGGWRISER